MLLGVVVAKATLSLTAALSMFGGVVTQATQADAYQAATASVTQTVQGDFYHSLTGALTNAATNSVQADWYHGLTTKDGWGSDGLTKTLKQDAYRMAPAAAMSLQVVARGGKDCDCLKGAMVSFQRFGLGALQKLGLGSFARFGLGAMLGKMLDTYQRPEAAGPGGLGLVMQRLIDADRMQRLAAEYKIYTGALTNRFAATVQTVQ